MNTYTVTTKAGKTYTVQTEWTDREAAQAIIDAENPTAFAQSIALKAVEAATNIMAFPLSEKQRSWLHVLATWATQPPAREIKTVDFSPILGLLNKAAEAQKRAPFIHLEQDGQPVLIRRAMAGHANVTSGGPFGSRLWFGRIQRDGSFVKGGACTLAILHLISSVAQDPALVAAQHGVATGYCCFCARDLSTKASRSVGYGPVCAEKFGLPWGHVDPALEAKGKEVHRGEG